MEKSRRYGIHQDILLERSDKAYPTLKITLTRTIYKPTFGGYGYDNRYWKKNTNNTVFNVNPVVLWCCGMDPAWNNHWTTY